VHTQPAYAYRRSPQHRLLTYAPTRHPPRRADRPGCIFGGRYSSGNGPVPLTPRHPARGAAARTPTSLHRAGMTGLDVQTHAGNRLRGDIHGGRWTVGLKWSVGLVLACWEPQPLTQGAQDWLTQRWGSWHVHPHRCPRTTPAGRSLNRELSWRASLQLTLMWHHQGRSPRTPSRHRTGCQDRRTPSLPDAQIIDSAAGSGRKGGVPLGLAPTPVPPSAAGASPNAAGWGDALRSAAAPVPLQKSHWAGPKQRSEVENKTPLCFPVSSLPGAPARLSQRESGLWTGRSCLSHRLTLRPAAKPCKSLPFLSALCKVFSTCLLGRAS